jgi:3-oxoadipate enol-lactonase
LCSIASMHFEDYGRGPAILLLHSTPGATQSFFPLAKALSSRARVLVPAMPGYGPSPRVEPYDLGRVREMIEDELLSRGVRSCAVVGHSGGTYRAFMMALAGRIRVEAMVLLGALAGLDETGRNQYRQLSAAVRAGAVDLGALYTETAVGPGFAKRHPERMREILTALDACPSVVLADEFGAFAESTDLRQELGRVRCRVLLRVGEADQYTPPAWSEALAASLPDATVQVVPGCGHCPLQEDETSTIDAITSWL